MSQIRLKTSLLILLLLWLVACNEQAEPESVVIYITATSEVMPTHTPTVTNTPTPVESTLSNTSAAESAPEILPSATPTHTPSQTPPPTDTPAPTIDATDTPLPAFPTSTPSEPPLESPTSTPATITLSPTVGTPTTTVMPPTPDNVPSADLLPILDSARMGIQIHPFITQEEWDVLLQHVRNLGLDWVKIQLPWEQLEPSPGNYDNDLLNYYVLLMTRTRYISGQDLNIILSIVNAPDWARPEGSDYHMHGPPVDPQAMANFIRAFLSNYEPTDDIIDAIEIWNEPNLDREWNGAPMSGGAYMDLFRPVYQAIKEVDPNMIVVTAGLAPVGDGIAGSVGDRTYLQQMYDAGLAQFPDVRIGVHPYGWGNPPDDTCCTTARGWADNPVFYFRETLQAYINIIQRNNHAAKIWVTEFGWGTYQELGPNGESPEPPAVAGFFDLVSTQQQAEYVVRAFEMMQGDPFGGWVELAFLWNLNFGIIGYEERTEQAGYGLLDAAGQPRLVYQYLARTRKIDNN